MLPTEVTKAIDADERAHFGSEVCKGFPEEREQKRRYSEARAALEQAILAYGEQKVSPEVRGAMIEEVAAYLFEKYADASLDRSEVYAELPEGHDKTEWWLHAVALVQNMEGRLRVSGGEQAAIEALRLASVRLEIMYERALACRDESGGKTHELIDEAEMFAQEARNALLALSPGGDPQP